MYAFHITLHARPKEAVACGSVELVGRKYSTLNVPRPALAAGFSLSFEEAAAALGRLPRMFIEPDGSFVWVSSAGDRSWQVDGVLYDRDGRLLFVDLKGTCSAPDFDRLLSAVGWPQTAVMFQLTREAVFVDEAAFRTLAVTN
jgi:hypothetical protein